MSRLTFQNCTAVITGASSGLGATFARKLAPHASALVLIARREQEMVALAESLRGDRPSLTVAVIACDLSDAGTRELLPARVAAMGLRVNILINNAGLGDYGAFASGPWHRSAAILDVNIHALTHLAHLFFPDLQTHAPSGMLNVSSLAGELPMPDLAVYAASKAYVSRFSEALRLELRPHGIHVTALCPGPVKTGFGETARRAGGFSMAGRHGLQTPDAVVECGLRALLAGRARAFPGTLVKATRLALNLIPAPLLRAVLARRPRRSSP